MVKPVANLRDQEIRVTFRSTDADALLIKDAMEKAALAMSHPTTENASALFELGCKSVAIAAQLEREKAA